MLAIKVPFKDAEKIRKDLSEKGLLDTDYKVKRDNESLLIPVLKEFKSEYEFVEKASEKIEKQKKTLKELLKEELSDEEIESLKTAYDHVGDIAIIEVDKSLEPKERLIAESLLKTNKNIKTVLKKGGIHEGEFRTQKMVFLAGIDKKETIHKENNVTLKLNVEEVYYSTRSSTERKRIAGQVRPGEEVLVMFSGAAPFVCVISKNSKAKEVVGIELNPIGHKYAEENVRINKLKNVKLINGDVKVEVPKLNKTFDRILMPLPKSAEDFLDTALLASKKGTIIHFYDFLNEAEFQKAHEKIKKACEKRKLKYKLLDTVKCGQFGPGIFRICVDFEILS